MCTHYSNSQTKLVPRNVAIQLQTDYTTTGVPVAETMLHMKNNSTRWWDEAILACYRIVSQYYYDRMGKIKNVSQDWAFGPGIKPGAHLIQKMGH
jgi:hypothetical protein